MNWKTKFKKGDIIEFCDELFEVIENHGFSGTVKEYFGENNYGNVVSNFRWDFQGALCKLVKSA